MEFMRRFLQHVLPTGFMKVRHYGFLSPNSSVALDEARGKIEIAYGFDVTEPEREAQPKAGFACGKVRQSGEVSVRAPARETVGSGALRVESKEGTPCQGQGPSPAHDGKEANRRSAS